MSSLSRPTARVAATAKALLTVDPAWRKSSHSGGAGACVEIAVPAPAVVAVRDSKDPSGPRLAFSPEAWAAFAGAAGAGEFGTV